MAEPKKGALHQLFVTLVDATDFASVESAVTASQFNAGTKKFYGVNTGTSAAATSGAVSKVASLVRSGVFRLTLKTSENNYDRMQVRVNGVTGCAEQIYEWENVDNDDSDILSAITIGNSRALLAQSVLSDIRSLQVASPTASDMASAVAVEIASRLSDILSAAVQTNSRVLVIQSQASDLASKLSDVESNLLSVLGTTGVQLNASSLSDLRSAITAGATGLDASALSDIASAVVAAIGAQGVALDASTMSDIRSAILVVQSMASDAHSAAAQGNSRALVIVSAASDLQSKLSDVESNLLSLLTTTGIQLNASSLSDLRSAITAGGGGGGGTVTASDISDIASAVLAAFASNISDILSAAQQVNSRVLLNQSRVSDIYSLLSDLHSDVGVASAVLSDVHSQLLAGVNVGAINGTSVTGDGNVTPWGPA